MRQDTHQKDRARNTLIIKERNIFNLNNRNKKNELKWIHHVKGMEPERIPEQLLDNAQRGTPPTGSPSYSGSINLFYRGTERIETSKP